MARVLKGRYFHETNILNAVQGRKASFIWKSILQGRDLLKKGLRFCIGNGSMVHAWLDPWLPTHPRRAPSKREGIPSQIFVKDMLNESKTGWDAAKLNDWVVPEDIPIIQKIKICSTAEQDLLGWHYTKNGIYSVKSAYWFATHQLDNQQPLPPPGNVELKQLLWKTKTAPKLQHFCWRLLSNSLSTGENLRYRHISNYATCMRCCREDETTYHLFFGCEYAQAMWRASGIPNPILVDSSATWEDKIRAIFQFNTSTQTPHLSQLPFWILWRIWKSRNSLVFQRHHVHWRTSLSYAQRDAKEWHEAESFSQLTKGHHQQSSQFAPANRAHVHRWTNPPTGFIKCNYDGSYVRDFMSNGGWVMRSDYGRFLGADQAVGILTNNPLESEFQALIMAMQSCWSQGYKKVYFEGDNKEVVAILNGKQSNFAAFNWTRDIRYWKNKFDECCFVWTNRNCNKAADILAKDRLPMDSDYYFHPCIPTVI